MSSWSPPSATAIVVVVFLCCFVHVVQSQGCLKCMPRTPNTDRCCRRFAMCCPPEKPDSVAGAKDEIRDKRGKCPEDRFPNATITICLRQSCTSDGHCFGSQKCCNFGSTKCCVYPLSPLFT